MARLNDPDSLFSGIDFLDRLMIPEQKISEHLPVRGTLFNNQDVELFHEETSVPVSFDWRPLAAEIYEKDACESSNSNAES